LLMLPQDTMLAGRGSSSGRDDTLSRLPCQFHAIQNNSVLWRSVVVERTDHINASSFMEAVSAAYLDCREWDKASTEICAPKDRASPCCLFVGTDGRRRALVPLWGVDHSTGAAIEGLVFRQRMFRTLEIGMFQGNTAYHIVRLPVFRTRVLRARRVAPKISHLRSRFRSMFNLTLSS